MQRQTLSRFVAAFAAMFTLAGWAAAADVLENDQIKAEFGPAGLSSITDKATGKTVQFADDGFSVLAGDQTIESGFNKPVFQKATDTTRIYEVQANPWNLQVVYEVKPGWRFVTKQIRVGRVAGERNPPKEFRVVRMEMFRGKIATPIAEQLKVRDGNLIRFALPESGKPGFGLFMMVQNYFGQFKQQDGTFSIAYVPNMTWKTADGAFESDRLVFGTYAVGGTAYPAGMTREWEYLPNAVQPAGPVLYTNEVDAIVECVRHFLLYKPTKSIRIHIPWCENDYQVDLATPEGRAEYKRVIDQAGAFGCTHFLFTPANGDLAPLKENRDAWGWENSLWANLGQKIRKGEWDPAKDPIPPSAKEMYDYVASRGMKLGAYVYPSMPFMQNPEWTSWIKGTPGGYLGADTGQRSFQDWLVKKMVDFSKAADCKAFCFDHWWIAYDDTPSSRYAQWYGCRRILEELRKQVPDVVIDGRQQYHYFGVWTWLAGSYPHPLNSDEQPGSFKAFPDLHFDRVSADRQRYICWWYRMMCFAPPEIMPGFITHQTQRNEPKVGLHRDKFRAADWDYLGWRYSLISSIATAPFNHVVNYVPARDEQEFKNFPDSDKKWFRDWLDWTDKNFETLRNIRPITGQPLVGRCDATAAIKDGKGFIFVFNPNYRPLPAQFKLDETIGLTSGKKFTLRQLYPDAEKGKLLAPQGKAFWDLGDQVNLPMAATDALVLELSSAPESVTQPTLANAAGSVSMQGDRLEIKDVVGEPGTTRQIAVALPAGVSAKSASVNGQQVSVQQSGDVATLSVKFAGAPFARCQQIGQYDPSFAANTFKAEATIPARVFQQLAERKRVWPIKYPEKETLSTWQDPSRLLLFINIAEPVDSMKVTLSVDGQAVEVKPAYTAVYREGEERTFVGWYADLSNLAPDKAHTFEAALPQLRPGQFQGLFFENVEPEFTKELSAAK